LLEAINEVKQKNRLVCAHNGGLFDRKVLEAKGFIFPLEQWRDSAVKALTLGLPASLDQLGQCLGLPQDQAKLSIGKKLINRFSVPAPANHKAERYTRHTHPREWEQFIDYAKRDVEAMRTLYKMMPGGNYQGAELALWHLDQRINDRGMPIDMALVDAAITLVTEERKRLNAELQVITGGRVSAFSGVSALSAWLRERGVIGSPMA
jgi:DNA polymerase